MTSNRFTEKEIEAMKGNITLLDEKIIHFKEYPTQDVFSANISFDEITKLADSYDKFCLIIDLTEAGRPSAETKKEIKKRFHLLKDSIQHTVFYTGKNLLITTAIRFVMYQIGLDSYSVHSSKENAITQIKIERGKIENK